MIHRTAPGAGQGRRTPLDPAATTTLAPSGGGVYPGGLPAAGCLPARSAAATGPRSTNADPGVDAAVMRPLEPEAMTVMRPFYRQAERMGHVWSKSSGSGYFSGSFFCSPSR